MVKTHRLPDLHVNNCPSFLLAFVYWSSDAVLCVFINKAGNMVQCSGVGSGRLNIK